MSNDVMPLMACAIAARGRLLKKLVDRLDAEALDQLRTEVARLGVENDELRDRLHSAETDRDFWWQEATDMNLAMCEATGGSPGITQAGQLVVVKAD